MKSVEQRIWDYATEHKMVENNDRILVGLSGGADSVCLFMWLLAMKERFSGEILGVHIHHGIRGSEADRDMNYAKTLCEQHDIEFICEKYNVPEYARENGLSEEEAGRVIRYAAFERIAKEKGFNKIAVAHHMDDSAETILFNLIRGSRAKGLTGIAPVSGNIIRPLLKVSKSEITEYLEEKNIMWCTDSTNLSEEYSRNKVRETIIPTMKEINAQAVRHILDSGAFIGEMYAYIEAKATSIYRDIVKTKADAVILPVERLLSEERVIRLEVIRCAISELAGGLKDVTAGHIEGIDDILMGQSGRSINLPYDIEVRKEQSELCICHKGAFSEEAPAEEYANAIEISLTEDKIYELPGNSGRLHVRIYDCEQHAYEEKSSNFTENMYTKCMDCGKIKDTLLLRTRKAGDYLVVNHGNSKKKLKEYFIDNKIPLRDRDKKLLLADGSHVLWVLGHRMSDGCKLTPETKRQIELTWEQYDTEVTW